MTKKETDFLYIERMIHSMETDFDQWTIKHCGGGAGETWTDYRSPVYPTENGTLSFGFGLGMDGAWIDGIFRWNVPIGANINPFNKQYRRFRKARRKMMSHLNRKDYQAYLETLKKSL